MEVGTIFSHIFCVRDEESGGEKTDGRRAVLQAPRSMQNHPVAIPTPPTKGAIQNIAAHRIPKDAPAWQQ
ncbi:hypothetical protein EJ06DRAFT_533549 [Trichodelitschia bisporula]|uniref:Uncharacterized protein n=1 Tax=Trichodelitschia bisporula TaxID=703511 RepID=A0A6G1HLD0_9PEZI|nr:hypothetical protein EJ06DRAFT_533549 [Trichodelitschia bisporula]